MAAEKRQTWLIACGGSEMDDVSIIARVIGTKHQVKKYLAKLIRDVKKDCETEFREEVECASTSIDSIEEDHFAKGRLYGYINMSDSHIDYTATPEEDVKLVELSH